MYSYYDGEKWVENVTCVDIRKIKVVGVLQL